MHGVVPIPNRWQVDLSSKFGTGHHQLRGTTRVQFGDPAPSESAGIISKLKTAINPARQLTYRWCCRLRICCPTVTAEEAHSLKDVESTPRCGGAPIPNRRQADLKCPDIGQVYHRLCGTTSVVRFGDGTPSESPRTTSEPRAAIKPENN